MAEGRGRAEWSHTSSLLALIANQNRDPKRKALTPRDFNPYERIEQEPEKVSRMNDLSALKAVFVRKR